MSTPLKQKLTNAVSVVELTSVEAKLTEAVTGDTVEHVAGFGTVGIEVELTVPTDELVTSEGFDGFDGFLDFHGCFLFSIINVTYRVTPCLPLVTIFNVEGQHVLQQVPC